MALGSTVPALLLAVTQIIVSDTHPAISKIVSCKTSRSSIMGYLNFWYLANEMRDVFSQYENSTHSLLITTGIKTPGTWKLSLCIFHVSDSSTNLRWTSMRESTVDENSSVPSNFDSTSFVSAIPRSYTVTDRKKSTMSPMLKTDKNIVTTTVDVLPKSEKDFRWCDNPNVIQCV